MDCMCHQAPLDINWSLGPYLLAAPLGACAAGASITCPHLRFTQLLHIRCNPWAYGAALQERAKRDLLSAQAGAARQSEHTGPGIMKRPAASQNESKSKKAKTTSVAAVPTTSGKVQLPLPFRKAPKTKPPTYFVSADFRILADMKKSCWRVMKRGIASDKSASWLNDEKGAWKKVNGFIKDWQESA